MVPGFSEVWSVEIDGVACDALAMFEARAEERMSATCLTMLIDPDRGISLLFGQGVARRECRDSEPPPSASELFEEALSRARAAARGSPEFVWRRNRAAVGAAALKGKSSGPARL